MVKRAASTAQIALRAHDTSTQPPQRPTANLRWQAAGEAANNNAETAREGKKVNQQPSFHRLFPQLPPLRPPRLRLEWRHRQPTRGPPGTTTTTANSSSSHSSRTRTNILRFPHILTDILTCPPHPPIRLRHLHSPPPHQPLHSRLCMQRLLHWLEWVAVTSLSLSCLLPGITADTTRASIMPCRRVNRSDGDTLTLMIV